jgi:hypothetical protein
MTALLLPASVASLALIEGAVTPYLFYWRTVTGAATVVLAVTVLVEAWVAGRWRQVTPVWFAALAGGVIAWSVLFTAQVARTDGPVSPFQPQAASVLSQMHAAGLPDGPFLVRAWGATEGGVAAALIDQFAREGRPVRVDRAIGYEFGYGRTATGRDVKWVYLVIENSAIYSLATKDSGHPRVVAVTHPLPAVQQDELIRLQRRVLAVLTADGYGTGQYVLDLDLPLVGVDLGGLPGMSASDLAELGRLNAEVAAHGCLCSVLQVPAKDLVVSDRGTYFSSVVLHPGGRGSGTSGGADAAGGPGAALSAR